MQPVHTPERSASGFALLAILLLVAALTMMVGLSLQAGEDSRRVAAQAHHEQLATSMAESGMERTRGYLLSILETDPDLDRALDPELDTNCSTSADTTGTDVDYVPAFQEPADGGVTMVVDYPPDSGINYKFISQGTGGYLVRIDDNEDDRLPASAPGSTDSCTEGSDPTPIRDRDRSVLITAIGFHPVSFQAPPTTREQVAQALQNARARRVLRARLGTVTGQSFGIIAGGDVHMQGNPNVCGVNGSLSTTGNLSGGGCFCGSGCGGGPPYQRCNPGNTCDAQTRGPTCSAGFGGGGGTCTPNATVLPPPRVEVWSTANAPGRCSTPMTCTPFYYMDRDGSTVRVHMWRYSAPGCANPRDPAFTRIPRPAEAPSCWKLVYDHNTSDRASCPGDKVRMLDSSDLQWEDPPIVTDAQCALSVSAFPIVWLSPGTSSPAYTAGCDSSNLYPPGAFKDNHTGGEFAYDPDPPPTTTSFLGSMPRGVWFIEGDLFIKKRTSPFSVVPAGWSVTLITTGTLWIENPNELYLRPAHPEGRLLVVGRDMILKPGNTHLWTCGEPPLASGTTCPAAAVMVHEQFDMGANSHLQAQLIVQDGANCSVDIPASQEAIRLGGNSTISVPGPLPISGGSSAPVTLNWSESSL